MKNKWLILFALLCISALAFWYFRIYLSGVHQSTRYLGKLEVPCLHSSYHIRLYQGNEQLESAQSLQFTLVGQGTELITMKHFGGTQDLDRKDAGDFSLACKDSFAYIVFDQTDTMERIDLRRYLRR